MTVTGLDISSYLEEEETRRRWPLPVEHLSASSLGMLARCPEQWRQRYVLGRKERPGEALVIGTAVHLAAEANFSQKVTSHEDIPLARIIDFYDDHAFPVALEQRQGEGDEIVWDTDPDGARKRGRAITYAYQSTVAPRVQPVASETKVEADFGISVPVIGYADVRTTDKVIDIKTSNKARRQIKPEWRIQGAVYSTITEQPVDFHCVSATQKDYRATVNTPLEAPELSLFLPPEARAETIRNVQAMAWMAVHFMETLGPDEPWPTTGQVHPWACGYCGYRPWCPAWKGID
jgi:PD-(D/E)XK nuclease superfamily